LGGELFGRVELRFVSYIRCQSVRLLFSIWIFPSHCLSLSLCSFWHHRPSDDNSGRITTQQHSLSKPSV
jgi:hypothetical protein